MLFQEEYANQRADNHGGLEVDQERDRNLI